MTKTYQSNGEYTVYFFATGREIVLKESEIEAINEEKIDEIKRLEREIENYEDEYEDEIDELKDEIDELKDEIKNLTQQLIEKEKDEMPYS